MWPLSSIGQEISRLGLKQAYELAQKNYPLIRQKDLVQLTADLTIENLGKGFLPQLTLSGQASYQSAVTRVNIPAPGIAIEPLSKDQYKVMMADVNQLIYDGGVTRQQKSMQQYNAEVERQKVEIELYKVRESINQVYLGILLMDEQLVQSQLTREDLLNGIKRVDARVKNGVAFRSELNVLQAELLKNDQRSIELRATRKGLIETLALFLNQPLAQNLQLEKPSVSGFSPDKEIIRPELRLYSSQDKLISSQSQLIAARNLPRASLFVQGGYGKPGLNLFKNAFDFFYMAGVRFNWSLSSFYTEKKEKQLVDVNRKMVDAQKETFLLTTRTLLKKQEAEIEKLGQLTVSDREIIDLRVKIKDAAKAQLENGVITANDYLREVNAEDQARQALSTHQLQWLQATINYQTILGKQ
jgi:outer membrane protein TolC